MSDKQDSDVGTTIVGGQPPKDRRLSVSVPAGVEKLLYLAATDRTVREELLRHRDRVAPGHGISLTRSEAMMVRLAPAGQLRSMIDALDVSASNVQRRSFLQAVAVSAAAVTAGAALPGCSDDDDKVKVDAKVGLDAQAGVDAKVNPGLDSGGIQPDISYLDGAVHVDVGGPKPAGIRPEEAGVKVDAPHNQPAGIRPDDGGGQ